MTKVKATAISKENFEIWETAENGKDEILDAIYKLIDENAALIALVEEYGKCCVRAALACYREGASPDEMHARLYAQ